MAEHDKAALSFKTLAFNLALAAMAKMKARAHTLRFWVTFVDKWGRTRRNQRKRPQVNRRRQTVLKARRAAIAARLQSRQNRAHKSKQRSAHGRG